MADGTENPVPDGAPYQEAGTDRVARIVAALRAAHAEQAEKARSAAAVAGDAVADDVTVTAAAAAVDDEASETPAPRRAATGVRPTARTLPTLRWDPGARYRASRLAARPAGTAPAPAAPVPPVPAPFQPSLQPSFQAPPPLAGRLFRGPARRTAVFEREIWHPATRSARVPRDVGDALLRAVERYRTGSISTSGLVRAIAETHAA
ncbi:hypothetical protein ACIG47_07785 [Promicromonospora sp. NPDC052451]|uniref:hypothetical protein n=1 Tax=Promicromonospora sp. NPDC052451 TaxID=3364407 RepID=UPI0037C728E5